MAEVMVQVMAEYQKLDAVVKPAVFNGLQSAGFGLQKQASTIDLPIVASPTPLLLSLAAYFLIVGSGLLYRKIAPRGKDAKDGYLLKTLMLGHNVFLVALSLYMCVGIIVEAVKNKYTLWGNAYNPAETKLAELIWVFYVSKLYEFMDTFIMLLKGNVNQVSFLHVYHHGSISFIWWMITYNAPGGDAYFSAALNSWVHVCMYFYYFLAAMLPKDQKTRAKYLWWGRYLTQMQMFQFFMNLVQAAYCWQYSAYPKFMSKLLLVYMISLLCLFGNFYIQKHMVKGKPKAKKV
jgi:elongation of very long chain fatty acids protein 4